MKQTTQKQTIRFSIKDEEHYNCEYNENVSLIKKDNVFGLFEDNNQFVLATYKDVLTVGNIYGIYEKNQESVEYWVKVKEKTEKNNLYFYLVEQPSQEEVFKNIDFYINRKVDMSNFQFKQDIEETAISSLTASPLYKSFVSASSYGIEVGDYFYSHNGTSIDFDYVNDASSVTLTFIVKSTFSRLYTEDFEPGENKIDNLFEIVLKISTTIGVSVNTYNSNKGIVFSFSIYNDNLVNLYRGTKPENMDEEPSLEDFQNKIAKEHEAFEVEKEGVGNSRKKS